MKNFIALLLTIAIIILACLTFYLYNRQPKIAYVDTGKLLDEYQAMRDAKAEYAGQTKQWQNNLDTLQQEVQQEIDQYKLQADGMSKAEREKTEKQIRIRQEQYYNYKKATDEKAGQEEGRLLDRVLSKTNLFMIDYGRKKGYDVIFGTTETGTILYGSSRHDITQEVLDALNADYKTQKK